MAQGLWSFLEPVLHLLLVIVYILNITAEQDLLESCLSLTFESSFCTTIDSNVPKCKINRQINTVLIAKGVGGI